MIGGVYVASANAVGVSIIEALVVDAMRTSLFLGNRFFIMFTSPMINK
jgi:hypothetical protein